MAFQIRGSRRPEHDAEDMGALWEPLAGKAGNYISKIGIIPSCAVGKDAVAFYPLKSRECRVEFTRELRGSLCRIVGTAS